MSTKHNARHDGRGPSRYPERLAARGETNASVRMPFIDSRGRHLDTAEALLRADREPAR